jgi:hypothetical protein
MDGILSAVQYLQCKIALLDHEPFFDKCDVMMCPSGNFLVPFGSFSYKIFE